MTATYSRSAPRQYERDSFVRIRRMSYRPTELWRPAGLFILFHCIHHEVQSQVSDWPADWKSNPNQHQHSQPCEDQLFQTNQVV